MATSDAIVIGESWISEHYFGTEATSESFKARVLQRRKEWDADKDLSHVRSRFGALRSALVAELVALDSSATGRLDPDPEVAGLYSRIVRMLGFERLGLTRTTDGPITRVAAAGLVRASWTALVSACPVDALETLLDRDEPTLLEPYRPNESTSITSVSRCLSTLFVDDDHPDFALVLAGRFLLVAERERWPEGRYLAVDLQLVAERNDDKRGGEVDRALTCLSAESLAPDAEGTIWWRGVLEESIRHTVGVSQDLRDGVRASIEIIANDVIARRAAEGLEPLRAEQAQDLARQALRFLYRILFLLFAEASPELGVLPVGAPEYERGYSLDRLRDLTLVELASPKARNGRHLYESLAILFRLVDQGHNAADSEDSAEHQGLIFQSLRADLFRSEAVELIHEVALSNDAMQRILRHLLLSKEKRGKDRGFISYAELGINQLGAVYEGLMSYTGFFAETDLYEVAKNGDGSKGSWVVPIERAEGIAADDFIYEEDELTGQRQPVLHERGSFVFRLAGRERQQSASYYTPEVLTRFVVSQALEELLDQDGNTTSAEEILRLTVCEPALGSGAFAIEATRQLAEQYLTRRQAEVGKRIPPESYPRELQRVKASIALHQVYGVDRNATAVELAEISLWLDTMVEGLAAPWFGLHLRRGNSLVGARRAVYSRDQVSKRTWLSAVPRDVPLAGMVDDLAAGQVGGVAGSVPHFLLPAEGWGSAVDAKEAKALAPDRTAELKAWRKTVLATPTRSQVDDLVELSHRVERLWQIAYQRLSIAEKEIRRSIPVWEQQTEVAGKVPREEIEAKLADSGGAYQRLRRVMDAWNALWFWPLTEALTTVGSRRISPPTLSQWITAVQQLLGREPEARRRSTRHQTLAYGVTWAELGQLEHDDLAFAGSTTVGRALFDHPWLVVCERIARQQRFFHWELDFASVLASGGFDLQLGNPPWYEPAVSEESSLAEYDPRWKLTSMAPSVAKARRATALAVPQIRDEVVDDAVDVRCTLSYLSSEVTYPELRGMRTDLYRNFITSTIGRLARRGVCALIHLESHFTHEDGGALREWIYPRLRRHWQYQNELKLFEIQNQKRFGVNVYGQARVKPYFLHATYLYHPDVLEKSLLHDGSGPTPGLKNPDGKWDLRPHKERIQTVTEGVLEQWATISGWRERASATLMSYAVVPSISDVLEIVAKAPKFGDEHLEFSPGWSQGSKTLEAVCSHSWARILDPARAVLQGSHISNLNSHFKEPNPSMKSNVDWTEVDLTTLGEAWTTSTLYQYSATSEEVLKQYDHWQRGSASQFYRLSWRKMVDNSGSRSLYSSLLPPGPTHTTSLNSLALSEGKLPRLLELAATASSLITDLLVRSLAKDNIYPSTVSRFPAPKFPRCRDWLHLRVLRLICLTEPYAKLWEECYSTSFTDDSWSADLASFGVEQVGVVSATWNGGIGFRRFIERRQALLELDVIVALALGVSIEQLCQVQASMFPNFLAADRKISVDTDGNVVQPGRKSTARLKGSKGSATAGLPGMALDREADMRQAYAHFEQRLKEQSDG